MLSIAYSYFILPTNEKDVPTISPTIYPFLKNGMIMIPYKQYGLHVHHWCFFYVLYLLQYFVNVPLWLYGFSFGLMVQGLMYEDCFEFIIENPYLSNI